MLKKICFVLILLCVFLIAGCSMQRYDMPTTQTQQPTTELSDNIDNIHLAGVAKTILYTRPTVTFNVKAKTLLEAEQVVTLNLRYDLMNDVALTKAFLMVRLLDPTCLVGKSISTNAIPVQYKIDGLTEWNTIATQNIIALEWKSPFSANINGTYLLRLRGDFSRAALQTYTGTVVVDFMREVGNTTFYVDPQGSNSSGDGTYNKPWQSIAYAVTKVAASQNNVINLRAGIYYEPGVINVPPGVSIVGAGEAATIIKSNYASVLFRLQSTALTNGNQQLCYFSIDGMSRTLDRAIYINNRNNVAIHHINFSEIDYTGLQINASVFCDLRTAPAFYMTGIQVYNCKFTNCAKDVLNASGVGGSSTGCIILGQLLNATVHDITIVENRGGGIKFANYGWLRGLKIYNCVIKVPSPINPYWANSSIELWNLYDDCEIYNNQVNGWFSLVIGNKGLGSKSVSVHHNDLRSAYVVDVPAIEACMSNIDINNNYIEGGRYGVAVWSNENVDSVMIHHNVFYNMKSTKSGESGVELHMQTTRLSNVSVLNNVFHSLANTSDWYPTGIRALFSPSTACPRPVLDTLLVRNNIFINTGTATNGMALITNGLGSLLNSNMSYNGMVNVSTGNFMKYPTTPMTAHHNFVWSDPKFVASGDPATQYYQLLPGSPAYQSGANVLLPYSGLYPSIGAF